MRTLLLLLGLVAAAWAAPVEHQVAGQSPGEAEVELTVGTTPAEGTPVAEAEVEIGSHPEDVKVSVSSSTSVEITTVLSSVSSEMEPLPQSAGRPGETEKAAPEEAEEEASGEQPEATSEAQEEVMEPGVEAGQTEEHQAVTQAEEEAADLELSTTLNDVSLQPAATAASAEAIKAAADETDEPTSAPSTVEVATSVSTETTQTMMSVTSQVGEQTTAAAAAAQSEEASGDGTDEPAVASDAGVAAAQSEKASGDGTDEAAVASDAGVAADESEESEEGSGEATTDVTLFDDDVTADGSGLQADAEASGASAGDDTTKGTLIFDLGPSASDELHDLVQQTVLDALMDEGLLSAAAAAADDARPVIEAEGSGIVFLDGSGSGDGATAEDVHTMPFVSIHF